MNFKEFFTWPYLATFTGAVAATGLITQFLKGLLDRFFDLPTRLLAYMVALAVLLAAQGFTGELTGPSAALSLLNAIIIATATSGAADALNTLKK